MGNGLNEEVIEIKFKQLYKSLDNMGKQMEALKDGIHKLELTTSNSIVELKTKLMLYVTIVSSVASVGVGYLMSHIN